MYVSWESYTKYIKLKIPLQSHSFPMHSYDIIKCSPNCARWLPIIALQTSTMVELLRFCITFCGKISYAI
jgi:hypothetical protein